MGTLVVNEDRKTIDKFRDWYKKKVVDSGISGMYEKGLNFTMKIQKGVNDVAGQVLPSVLAFVPEASFMAPIIPAITKVGNMVCDLEEKAVIGTKRFVEASFLGVDGSSKEVILPSVDLGKLGEGISNVTKDVMDAVNNVGKEEINENVLEVESAGRSRWKI